MNQEETRRDRGEPASGAPPESVEVCEGCGVLAGTPCFPWPCDDDGDDVRCECGNEPHFDGFYPCDSHGVEVEPVGEWSGLYSCARCGRLHRFEAVAE